MGLTNSSTGKNAVDSGLLIKKQSENDKVIALAGNPNVGKSTVFNGLTGLNQHTGNWPGKTVTNAQGYCSSENNSFVMVDIPGTYSLLAHSAEEEVARNFICFGNPDSVVVVCDATCLERNLNLVLQTIEITGNVIVCVNLMDEAKRKHIKIDLQKLSELLGVPVISTVARKKKSLNALLSIIDKTVSDEASYDSASKQNLIDIRYADEIETAVNIILPEVARLMEKSPRKLNCRWLCLRLLDIDSDASLLNEISSYLGEDFLHDFSLSEALNRVGKYLRDCGINNGHLRDMTVSTLVGKAEEICKKTVSFEKDSYNSSDRKFDSILTGKATGFPIMLLLLALIFWTTITGANYPSELISSALFALQEKLTLLFEYFNAPAWLHGSVVLGIYRVLAWVVSVMLPPMAIFFPLFTLLEDSGYLPRIAYNLDKPFKCCSACGKQALTMCMGFGCNAAGIIGCRIINSPRERLLAILTNNFVPCNGRFPMLISIFTMFFVFSPVNSSDSALSAIIASVFPAVLLTAAILFSVLSTFAITKLLSLTFLRGVPSSFTLELPPYRRPQIGKVLVRSVFDRTLFVLARAAAVAAPAGLIIWLMANVTVADASLLNICSEFLDPFAKLLGLDGVILIAFILGFPANEIVVPVIIMAYMASGSLTEIDNLSELKQIFIQNGWTILTAINTVIFSLMHWPCSTTLLTIKKETGSLKWTMLAFAIPTVCGVFLCMLTTLIAKIIGI